MRDPPACPPLSSLTTQYVFVFQGVLADNAAGLHPTDIIYNDADAAQIATLEPERLHRPVDLAIEEADKQGMSLHLTPAYPSGSPS